MKEVVRVSISGIAFTFNYDAYEVMKQYLAKLESGYTKNPDGREIIADIEARIAELILNEQQSDKPIDINLTQSIIGQLGFPDDIEIDEEARVEKIPKRLYRNSTGAILGGVCSGLGSYFKIDTVWVRLIFSLPLLMSIFRVFSIVIWPSTFAIGNFFGGIFNIFILLYIILWVSTPMAKTPRQKLEMQGERITASSIKNIFQEEAPNAHSPKGKKSASALADVIYGAASILQFFIKAILFIIAMAVSLALVAVIIALVTLLFTGGIVGDWIYLDLFSQMVGITPIIYIALTGVVSLIPLFMISYFSLKLLFNSKVSRSFMLILAAIWLVVAIYLSVITVCNRTYILNGVNKIIYDSEFIDFDIDDDDDDIRLNNGAGVNINIGEEGISVINPLSGVDIDINEDGVSLQKNTRSITISKHYKKFMDDLDDDNVRINIRPFPANDSVAITKTTLNPTNMRDTLKTERITLSRQEVEALKKSPGFDSVIKSILF